MSVYPVLGIHPRSDYHSSPPLHIRGAAPRLRSHHLRAAVCAAPRLGRQDFIEHPTEIHRSTPAAPRGDPARPRPRLDTQPLLAHVHVAFGARRPSPRTTYRVIGKSAFFGQIQRGRPGGEWSQEEDADSQLVDFVGRYRDVGPRIPLGRDTAASDRPQRRRTRRHAR